MLKALMTVAAAVAMFGGPALAANPCKLLQRAELPVTMRGARPMVPASLNGMPVMFLADSGAFWSTLSPALAKELRLSTTDVPGMRIVGVGGDAPYAAYASVEHFTLGKADIPNVTFMVTPGAGGGGSAGLLGQNVWAANDVEFDLQAGVIRLFKTDGCANANLAYWAGDKPYGVVDLERVEERNQRIVGQVVINGVTLRATFDTGSSASILTLRAARRAGVTPQTPGVVAAGMFGGIGDNVHRAWIGPFASFKIGGEEIKSTRLRFADIEIPDTDMLLGADFFLSHRVYVANSRRKVFFTYNGGPVFNLNGPADPSARPAQPPTGAQSAAADTQTAVDAAPKAGAEDEPKDADAFARRGAARAARHDYEQALADFDHAIQLASTEPKYYYQRASVHAALKQELLAKADLDQTLKLQPDHIDARVIRAAMNLAAHDRPGAVADLDVAAAHAAKEADIRLAIANLYSRMGLFQKAIDNYDPWIASHGDETSAPVGLAGRCWSRGQLGIDLDKALGDCNRAAGKQPENMNIRATRGLVQLRRGALDDALADYNAALAKLPKNGWALYGRGIVELRKGMKAEGEADLAAAKAAAPNLAEEARTRGIAPPS